MCVLLRHQKLTETHQTFFISDLHLDPSRLSITENFIRFLETEAQKANALYILGDFFEVWAGDDDPNPHHKKVIEALAQFSKTKIPLYFMRGNRDFLIDKAFAKATGCLLIPDPTVIELYGQKILLMHGDSLCTQDRSHQRFRKFSQNPIIRKLFLNLFPFSWRLKIASGIRKKSQKASADREQKSLLNLHARHQNPYDVCQAAVEKVLLKYHTHYLIHGHTHKPDMHEFTSFGKKNKRIVLGEWGVMGSVLVYSKDTLELKDWNGTILQ